MILTISHLLACIALAVLSFYGRKHDSAGESVRRLVLPLVIACGLLALLILYQYFMEFFVASYSGAIYEVSEISRGHMAWLAISAVLMLLPLVGLIPSIRRRALVLLTLACLAAVPGIVALVSNVSNQHAETQDPPLNGR